MPHHSAEGALSEVSAEVEAVKAGIAGSVPRTIPRERSSSRAQSASPCPGPSGCAAHAACATPPVRSTLTSARERGTRISNILEE
eukprot:6177294-Pleurochrysis_carterae.AAC.6